MREMQTNGQGTAQGEAGVRWQGHLQQNDDEVYAEGHAGAVGTWEDSQENPPHHPLSSFSSPHPPSSAPPPAAANLSRMNSTRRYMAELDADEEDDFDDEEDEIERLGNGGRLTWQTGASAYESEARDSVASLQAPSFALARGNSQKSARSTGGKGGVPRESTLTMASMEGPFGYSVRYTRSHLPHELY